MKKLVLALTFVFSLAMVSTYAQAPATKKEPVKVEKKEMKVEKKEVKAPAKGKKVEKKVEPTKK